MSFLKENFQKQLLQNKIDDEYRYWKSQSYNHNFGQYTTMVKIPFDNLEITALQWLPDKNIDVDQDRNCFKFLMSIHDPKSDKNYLYASEIRLPSEGQTVDIPIFDHKPKTGQSTLAESHLVANHVTSDGQQ
jgi:hypothetical protein